MLDVEVLSDPKMSTLFSDFTSHGGGLVLHNSLGVFQNDLVVFMAEVMGRLGCFFAWGSNAMFRMCRLWTVRVHMVQLRLEGGSKLIWHYGSIKESKSLVGMAAALSSVYGPNSLTMDCLLILDNSVHLATRKDFSDGTTIGGVFDSYLGVTSNFETASFVAILPLQVQMAQI